MTSLQTGRRLGPYEILEQLGAGGMGEVYKARDTRLDRTVAIKVLSSSLVASADLRARFEREARAISQLNHPHICLLFDVGREGDTDFLVLEYLEGETLAERLRRGALPLEQALTIAIQIAGALDKAHRAGLAHRDLKPGNIMLGKSGAKLLDFGLAKPMDMVAGATSGSALLLSAAVTMTSPSPQHSPLTAAGSIVGTIQYMSPEQIQGQEADARSDIFAFGAVLYEMVTGRRPFQGKSQISMASAILEQEPAPVRSSHPAVPGLLDQVIAACLAKDPELRLQSALDLQLQLRWIAETSPPASSSLLPANRRREWAGWALAAVLAVAAVTALLLPARTGVPAGVSRLSVAPPEPAPSFFSWAQITPDGRTIVFNAESRGRTQLWTRRVDSLKAEPLAGTESAGYFFLSPDSRFVAFDTIPGAIRKVPIAGGPTETLYSNLNLLKNGSWAPDGTILLAGWSPGPETGRSGLYTIPSSGGTPAKIEITDQAGKPLEAPFWPSFLPDSDHFLITTESHQGRYVYVGSLKQKRATRLFQTDSRAQFVEPGHILYMREGTLLARVFDPKRLALLGEPAPLAQGVSQFIPTAAANFSASGTGTLTYLAGGTRSRLLWYNRAGKPLAELPANEYGSLALSPEGKRLVLGITDPHFGTDDLWLADANGGTPRRLTTDPGAEIFPVWSPDGREIAYSITKNGIPPTPYRLRIDGGQPEQLFPPAGVALPWSWSPDGRSLLYSMAGDLMSLPMQGERKPQPMVKNGFQNEGGRYSPDGRWLAYDSNESGSTEVYVQARDGSGKRRLSLNGGWIARWRADGRELFYLSADNSLMAVPVKPGAAAEFGAPTPLFKLDLVGKIMYDVAPDGSRFIATAAVVGEAAPQTTVVLNWAAELKK